MALRTAEQYIESLRDDRAVFYAGQRVTDVTAHPDLGVKAHQLAEHFGAGPAGDAATLARVAVALPDGDLVHRWFWAPHDREDLQRYVEMEEGMEDAAHGAIMAGHNALKIVAAKIDAKFGTDFQPRVDRYVDWVARNDLSSALAMTDAKGDRSKPPHQQADPDLWLRVVERRSDGVVIRGAKTSVTNGALANELLVLPTHAMSPADADWSVACAVPANAPGVRFLSNYVGRPWGEAFRFDRPVHAQTIHHDATVVFDNVFVPWERVFMDGQSEYTRQFLTYFTSLHRAGVIVKEPRATKKLIGAAQLMARYNGLESVGNIRNGIAEMVQTAQMLDILRYTALNRVELVEGICVPYGIACNLAGLTVTATRTNYLTFLCELAGGPVLTAPSGLDIENPETRDDVLKYYVGKEGVGATERLRLVKYIYDIAASDTAGFTIASSVTAAGSPGARRVAVARGFDVEACIGMVLEELDAAVPAKEPAPVG